MTRDALCKAGTMAPTIFLAALGYRRVWQRLLGSETTPTGFGVLLAPCLLVSALVVQAPPAFILALCFLSAGAAIYWIDDVKGLPASARLGISFFVGFLIGVSIFQGSSALPVWLVFAGAVGIGILNTVLTNIVNFTDGADLNLATFIALTAVVIVAYEASDSFQSSMAIGCLAFTIPFAALNHRPRVLYLGDAGAFAFAGFLSIMAAAHASGIASTPEAALPLALPAFDALYVLVFRIANKENLLTRNYLHLYQRLNRTYRGFGYLLPQVVNVAFSLVCAFVLHALGMSRFLAVMIAAIAVTVPFYFACRLLLLDDRRGVVGRAE